MTVLFHQTYASAGDWYDQCQKDEAHPQVLSDRREHNSNWNWCFGPHDKDREHWSHSATRDVATSYAREGWKEGREKMLATLAAVRPTLRPATIKARDLDVAGSFPLVPAAVAGDPLNMFTIGERERATRPILRLVAEQWGSAGITRDELMRRGAALLAHIDRLEGADIRCELTVRYSSSNCENVTIKRKKHPERTANFVTDIIAKRADEPLEIDRLAFLLIHPSALRRLYFGSMHTLPDGAADAWTRGHGLPPSETAREVEPSQILIPTANEWTSEYRTDAGAAAIVEKFLNDGIKKMADSGFRADLGSILEDEAA